MTLALQTNGGDEALDFRGFGVFLLVWILRSDRPSNNILPHIVILAQIEEFPDMVSPLGTQPLRQHNVRQSGDTLLALLDDHQGDDGEIGTNDATTDRLASSLGGALSTVTGSAGGEEEFDTVRKEDTLLHGEALLVISTANAEDVSLEFVADTVTRHFLAHALVIEDAIATLFIDVEELLLSCGRVGDIELHVRL